MRESEEGGGDLESLDVGKSQLLDTNVVAGVGASDMNAKVHHAAEAFVAVRIAARQLLVARGIVFQTPMGNHRRFILKEFVTDGAFDAVDRTTLITLRFVTEMREAGADRDGTERNERLLRGEWKIALCNQTVYLPPPAKLRATRKSIFRHLLRS